MSRKLNEEIFDVFLSEALRQVEEEELEQSDAFFEAHKTDDYLPSKRFVGRIKRAYRIHCIKRTVNSKAMRRVASILLTVGIVSGSMAFLVDANIFSLYNTIFLRKERYTSIETYKKIVSEEQEDSMDFFYFPKYIPVGFEVAEEISEEMLEYVRFEKEDSYFCISQWFNSPNVMTRLDTEDAVVIDVEIDGNKGFYAEKEGKQSIYLNMGKISVNIYGNIGKKELFQMAENLELLEK